MTQATAMPEPEGARYSRRLFALLALATFFEGFDTMLTSLVLPQISAEFAATPAQASQILSVLGVGAVLGFLPLRLADVWGRRPLLLASIAGYTLLSLATAASRTLEEFTWAQFGARFFMVTELALAYVMLSEEVPAEKRGRMNGWLGACASVGAVIPALLLPSFLERGLSWRGLYAVGGALIVLLPIYFAFLRETRAFRELPRRSLRQQLSLSLSLFDPQHRRRLLAATLLWFGVDLWNAGAMFHFSYYVQRERGWDASDLQIVMPVGGLFQFAGYALAGRLMDRFGRRRILFNYLVIASAASLVCYLSTGRAWVAGGYFLMTAMGGMWSVAHTVSAELFPTALRATANGVSHNLFGRCGMVVGPMAVGVLAPLLGGTGNSVALVCGLCVLFVPVLSLLLPETRSEELVAAPGAGAASS